MEIRINVALLRAISTDEIVELTVAALVKMGLNEHLVQANIRPTMEYTRHVHSGRAREWNSVDVTYRADSLAVLNSDLQTMSRGPQVIQLTTSSNQAVRVERRFSSRDTLMMSQPKSAPEKKEKKKRVSKVAAAEALSQQLMNILADVQGSTTPTTVASAASAASAALSEKAQLLDALK
jgi:hypothetical protein